MVFEQRILAVGQGDDLTLARINKATVFASYCIHVRFLSACHRPRLRIDYLAHKVVLPRKNRQHSHNG